MVSVSEVFKAFDEGFTNKDSSRLAEFLTDDFEMTRTAGGARSRQQTLGCPSDFGQQPGRFSLRTYLILGVEKVQGDPHAD